MLAIVFWNTPRHGAGAACYRDALREFHAALARSRPKGFRFSATFAAPAVPWFEPDTEIYEDWYVLSNFAAVDSLDEAVLHAHGREPHRYLMRHTGSATGAVFGLTNGGARLQNLTTAHWFFKPRDVSAEDLAAMVTAQIPAGRFSYWTRALALGPAGDCLLSSEPIELPEQFDCVTVQRRLVWPRPATTD